MVSLVLSWIFFPIMLAAVGAGWGVLVEKASGAVLPGALLIPVGLAAVIVEADLLTLFSATASAAVWVAAAGAIAGLVWGWRQIRVPRWAIVAAAGTILVYGAPVILSGQDTFLGYIRLDDTSTWLNVVDILMHHGHSAAGLPQSTFALTYSGDVGPTYPMGAFVLLGVGHFITGIDAAWIFQPYIAFCAAAAALGIYALLERLVGSPRVRALVAFGGVQAALLYGYTLWGGIKEAAAAFLLVLGVALVQRAVADRRPPPVRQLLPLAVSGGALICTLSFGAAAWVVPALVVIAVMWLRPVDGRWHVGRAAGAFAGLVALTALCVIPVLRYATTFLAKNGGLVTSSGDSHILLGNLDAPLRAIQLAGIWPNGQGDFRLPPPQPVTYILVWLTVAAAGYAVWRSIRLKEFGIALYVTLALLGCAIVFEIGSTPWVVAKALAFSSPALLTAGLAGGALLAIRFRPLWVLPVVLIAAVIWSNYLQYHDVLLAPRPRLAELQHIDGLLGGHSPTFVNQYDVYADRHFLRDGAPVEPAEYRPVNLATTGGKLLVDSAWADLDAFPLSTLEAYPSLVTGRSPTYSRPPSNYRLVWQGRYYQLWQQPRVPTERVLQHVPLGDSNQYPYCGNAENASSLSVCPEQPVATPPCSLVQALGRQAAREHAELVAYRTPPPIVARADQSLWPGTWYHNAQGHSLTPYTVGTAIMHIALDSAQRYQLWLGGSFARGFNVSVDGRPVGRVKDELGNTNQYVPVATLFLRPGVHTFRFQYPPSDLTPGSGDNRFTMLSNVALEPSTPSPVMLRVAPRQARTLCGSTLDWIEIVQPLSGQR